MSDVDYQRLFENGQLVFTEQHHKEILDRMWQAAVGHAEENIFRNKYRPYLAAYHPEALEPPVAVAVVPEPAIPEEPVVLVEPPKPEALPEPEIPEEKPVETPVAPVEEAPKKGRGRRSVTSPK